MHLVPATAVLPLVKLSVLAAPISRPGQNSCVTSVPDGAVEVIAAVALAIGERDDVLPMA
jgi:hypothetical protein